MDERFAKFLSQELPPKKQTQHTPWSFLSLPDPVKTMQKTPSEVTGRSEDKGNHNIDNQFAVQSTQVDDEERTHHFHSESYKNLPVLLEYHLSNTHRWMIGINRVLDEKGEEQPESILETRFSQLSTPLLYMVFELERTLLHEPIDETWLNDWLFGLIGGNLKSGSSLEDQKKSATLYPIIGEFINPELRKGNLPLTDAQQLLLSFFSKTRLENSHEVAILLIEAFLREKRPQFWQDSFSSSQHCLDVMFSIHQNLDFELMQKLYSKQITSRDSAH